MDLLIQQKGAITEFRMSFFQFLEYALQFEIMKGTLGFFLFIL